MLFKPKQIISKNTLNWPKSSAQFSAVAGIDFLIESGLGLEVTQSLVMTGFVTTFRNTIS